MNADWDWFILWRSQFPKLEIILVKGNHDIIDDKYYEQLNIALHSELLIGPFLMLHHPLTDDALQYSRRLCFLRPYTPRYKPLQAAAGKALHLPCFAFGNGQAVLPSFGKFTGRVAIRSNKTDRIFAIAKDKVIEIN